MSLLDRIGRFIDDVLLLPDDVRARLERGERALSSGDLRLADRVFTDVLRERPTLVRAHVGLAETRSKMGEPGEALTSALEARKLEPADPEIALLTAELALQVPDLDVAADAARDAASRFVGAPGASFARACAVRARVETKRGRPDRAARELRKAIAATPEDGSLRVELVEALAASGRDVLARTSATGIDASTISSGDAVRLGLALHRAGAGHAALPWLERGADAGSDAALVMLSQIAMEAGELELAETRARKAVARGGGAPALGMLATTALARGNAREASDAYASAAMLAGGDVDLMRLAVRAAPIDARAQLVEHADALERLSPGDEEARGARAFAAIAAANWDEATALVAEGSAPRLLLARARLHLHAREAKLALAALDLHRDAVLRLDSTIATGIDRAHPFADREAAEAIRRDALRDLWRADGGEVDLAAAIDAVARFGAEQGIQEIERRALQLRDELDRPLLLAVMGEFNAGKSTFINAFVGADVAPTGILPTTATLNILRGGAERFVRVVYRDGTTREGAYETLRAILKEASREPVDHIEIVLPSDTLDRVWILDTPGSNALDEGHAELAKEAARRADAALWVFDATQAGKASEGERLAMLASTRRLVLPVLNKVDRLTEEERDRVERTLVASLPSLRIAPIGFSAREALRARLANDEEALERSGYDDLLARLEQEVFARSRDLKRQACSGRLLEVLSDTLAREPSTLAPFERSIAELNEIEKPLERSVRALSSAVDDVILELETAQATAFREAAAEVLAFVQPRKNRFATQGAEKEDRAFLADVIERRLVHATATCSAQLVGRATATLDDATRGLAAPRAMLDARVRAAVSAPFADFAGYQRGLLAGGALRRFFDEALPQATLELSSIASALTVARADPRVDLRPALVESLTEIVSSLEAERVGKLRDARRELFGLSSRLYDPLRALRDILAELIR